MFLAAFLAAGAAPPGSGKGGKDLFGDPLPLGASVRLGTVRFRHGDNKWISIFRIAFSKDGQELLSVGDGSVRVWDSRTGRLVRSLPTDGLNVRGAAFSLDGRLVALGGFTPYKDNEPGQGMIRVLDLTTGKEVCTFSRGKERSDHVALAFTPDRRILASLGGAGILRLEEIATGTELLRQKFSPDILSDIAFSPDGSLLAVAAGPNARKVFLWEWQGGKEPREVKAGPRGARSVAFSLDGTTLATGDDGKEGIRLWTVPGGRLLRRVGEPKGWDTNQVGFSPDGRYLAEMSSQQKALILYDPRTGKEVRRMAGLRQGAGRPVFSRDSRRLAAVGDGVLRVWDVETGKDLSPDAEAHRQAPSFVALLRDGTALTGGDDGTVRLWDGATGRQKRKIDVTDHWVRGLALSPDGRWLATSELGDKHAVRLWDLATGHQVHRLAGHGRLGGFRAFAFTPDSKQLASWGDDMRLRLWAIDKGKAVADHEVRPAGAPPPGPGGLKGFPSFDQGQLSPDGSLLVVAQDGPAGGFCVFDATTGKQKIKFANEGGSVSGLAVSSDGKHLLASTWGKAKTSTLTDGRRRSTTGAPLACLYEIATGNVVHRIELSGKQVGAVAFTADGKTFAVGIDKQVRLHKTASGTACGAINHLPGTAHALAFAPDGKRLIAGLPDTTAVIWDLPAR
jgi:WD40 repeat protein